MGSKKDNQTKKNRKSRQMKTLHSQTILYQTTKKKHYHKNKRQIIENVKRIMNSERIILPSLRNIEWKTLKTETNNINHKLPYIPTNNITEINELIYAGAKLVCENIGIPSKSTKKQ